MEGRARVGFLLGVVKFGLLFVSIDLGLPAGLSSLLLQLQVVFTIVFAGVVLGERPRREQVAGAAVAFAGLARDRRSTAPPARRSSRSCSSSPRPRPGA